MYRNFSILNLLASAILEILSNSAYSRPAAPKPSALASSSSQSGGNLYLSWNHLPASFNLISGNEELAKPINTLVSASLVWMDYETWEPIPYLAENWDSSANSLTIKFTLNSKATFSDSRPVSANDVVFTFDLIFDPAINAPELRAQFSWLRSWREIDSQTVEFELSRPNFTAIEQIGSVPILPRSIFGKQGHNFNRDFNYTLIGAGPYLLPEKTTTESKIIKFDRVKKWWGNKLPWAIGIFAHDVIEFRVIDAMNDALSSLQKNEIDAIELTPINYVDWSNKITDDAFPSTKFLRLSYAAENPNEWAGIALNTRSPPCEDLKFRVALQNLFDQAVFSKDLFGGRYIPIWGPFGIQNIDSSSFVTDTVKSINLLESLRYNKFDVDGIRYREVDGKKQRAELSVLFSNPSNVQFLKQFVATAKTAGIQINLENMDFSAALQKVESWEFQAFVVGWTDTPSLLLLFRQWSSKSADLKGSLNYSGIAQKQIDKLIVEIERSSPQKKRSALLAKLNEALTSQHPYIWRWKPNERLWIINIERVGLPSKTFQFTGNSLTAPPHIYWWSKMKS